MAQESGSQNKNSGGMGEFFQKNQIWLIAAAILILAGGYYLVTRNDDRGAENTNQENQQETGENTGNGNEQNENQNGEQPEGNGNQNGQPQGSGNVSATGTLRESDNSARGNLMIESSVGKIYISTQRDFSSLIGKQVDLDAEGTLNQFVFLNLTESGEQDDEGEVGGASEEARNVNFTGTLRVSENLERGDYTISSEDTTVYLLTVHDYSGWVGEEVNLSATGTIDSFTNATLAAN